MTHAPVTILVVAAVIEGRGARAGHYLVTRRQPGVHLSGHWEFPGGKCERGESLAACPVREIREELDVEARVGLEILVAAHDYPDRRVELHFMRCELGGDPHPQQGQEMRWVPRQVLTTLSFPAADQALIRLLTA